MISGYWAEKMGVLKHIFEAHFEERPQKMAFFPLF